MYFVDTILVIIVSYLLGSVPYGLLLTKYIHKIDIRTIGSGNIGTSNIYRAGYKLTALLTLLADALKGLLAVVIFEYIYSTPFELYMLAGVVAVTGHIFPIWLKFKGGKGVATSFGVMLIYNPWLFLITVIIWFVVAKLFRYSSLAALSSYIITAIITWWIDPFIIYYVICLTLLIIFKHKDNIVRLITKTENKL